jgi:hypothetical protein
MTMTSEKQPRKGILGALDRVYAFVDGLRGLIMIVSALSAGGITGTVLASDGDTAARLDTLEIRQDSTAARQSRMEERVNRLERQQMDFFSAQVEADSSLRAVLERRAMDRERAAQERRAVEKLINLGGSP